MPAVTESGVDQAEPDAESEEVEIVSTDDATSAAAASMVAVERIPAVQTRSAHLDALKTKFIDLWIDSAKNDIGDASPLIAQCQDSGKLEDHLRHAFHAAGSTLETYWRGWHKWVVYCHANDHPPGHGSIVRVADFLVLVLEGDWSSASRGSISAIVRGMDFAARRLMMPEMTWTMKSPIIQGYLKESAPTSHTEAPPFPACAVGILERLILKDKLEPSGVLVVGFFLLCIYAGLRYSDAMNTKPTDLFVSGWILRGFSWRVKPDKTGMPFACLLCGFYGKFPKLGWGHKWLQALDVWLLSLPSEERSSVDFLLPAMDKDGNCKGEFMPAPCAVTRLRKILVEYGAIDADRILEYTSHSAKDTLLAWGKQIDASKDWCQAQGHHRVATGSSQCVSHYSRDDVIDALRLQELLIRSIRRGWRPSCAQQRGAKPPLPEKPTSHCVEPEEQEFVEGFRKNSEFDPVVPEARPGACESSEKQGNAAKIKSYARLAAAGFLKEKQMSHVV